MSTRQSAGSLRQQTKARREKAPATPLAETSPFVVSGAAAPSTDTQSLHAPAANRKIRWRWGMLAAFAMALLSLYPQIDLWLTRGVNWQGAFAFTAYDEEMY